MIRLHLAVWITDPVTWLLALMCVLATAAGTAAAWTAAGSPGLSSLPMVNIVTLTLPLLWAAATVFTALILPRAGVRR